MNPHIEALKLANEARQTNRLTPDQIREHKQASDRRVYLNNVESRKKIAAEKRKQLYTNGVEILPFSTLQNRFRTKAERELNGWHLL